MSSIEQREGDGGLKLASKLKLFHSLSKLRRTKKKKKKFLSHEQRITIYKIFKVVIPIFMVDFFTGIDRL